MTEIAEVIAMFFPKNFEWKCPHVHDKVKYPAADEDLDAEEEDEEKAAEGQIHDTKNSSKKLRTSLGETTAPKGTMTVDQEPDGEYSHGTGKKRTKAFAYSSAAHHEIPGNDGLKASLIVSWVSKSPPADPESGAARDKKIVENIGYNVNGDHNGIWLVGSYAVRGGANCPEGVTWGQIKDTKFQESYVRSAILTTGQQFHDTHKKYSAKVVKHLDTVALQMDKTNKHFCDECKEAVQNGDLLPPPYWLRDRLATFSAWCGGKLVGTTKSQWKLAAGWCTTDNWKYVLEKM